MPSIQSLTCQHVKELILSKNPSIEKLKEIFQGVELFEYEFEENSSYYETLEDFIDYTEFIVDNIDDSKRAVEVTKGLSELFEKLQMF